MTDGQAEPGAFSCWLGGEERIEHPFLNLNWYAGAIIANPDFHTVAEISSCCRQGGLVSVIVRQAFALGRSIESV